MKLVLYTLIFVLLGGLSAYGRTFQIINLSRYDACIVHPTWSPEHKKVINKFTTIKTNRHHVIRAHFGKLKVRMVPDKQPCTTLAEATLIVDIPKISHNQLHIRSGSGKVTFKLK